MKKLSILLSMILAVALIVACGDEGSAAASDAEAAITTAPAGTVTPNDGAEPTPPAQEAAPAGPTTTLTFDETEFNFGKVDEGEMVAHTFKFKNTGSEPLIISNAKGSCGCTVPKWPREPIPPGEGSEITVEFNSKGKKGNRNQKVTITANTNPPQSFVALVGEVIPDPNAAAPAAGGQPQIQMNQ